MFSKVPQGSHLTRSSLEQALMRNVNTWFVKMSSLCFNSVSFVFAAITASIIFPRELRNTSGDQRYSDPANPVHAAVKRANNELTAICGHLDKRFKESRSSQEWKKIALVMDRLTFYLYLLVCIMSLIAIITVWHGSIKTIPKHK